jgi:hypothetical protein
MDEIQARYAPDWVIIAEPQTDEMLRVLGGKVIVFALTRFSVLGQHQFIFPVAGPTLPSGSDIDGLLGLDFLRDQNLNIDFRLGQLTLT